MRKTSSPVFLAAALLLCTLIAPPLLADAIPTGDEFTVNQNTSGDQEFAALAPLPGGGFVVTWESFAQDGSFDGIFLRRYDTQGNALGDELQVNTYTPGNQEDPSVAVAADGTFLVVWDSDSGQDGQARGIFGQLFDSTGTPMGGELAMNANTTGDQNDAVATALPDGGFVVVWETNLGNSTAEDLVGRRFDAAGAPLTDEFDLNLSMPGDQEDVDIGRSDSGDLVVVWESAGQDGSYDSVIARRFDANGIPLSDEIQVNTYTLGDQDDPDLTVASDGSFLVIWEDDAQVAFDDTIVARYFDAAGTAVTDEIPADTFADAIQINPSVTFAPNSNDLAYGAWQSLAQDGDDGSVILRALSTTGTASDEMVVNTITTGFQGYPHLTSDDNGFLVVWETFGQDAMDSFGLSARHYEVPFFSDGFESGDTSAWSVVIGGP